MRRESALELVKKYVKNKNSIKHMLAVEAVMKNLARRFNEDEELWALAGLVHDIDMEIVDYVKNPSLHGKETERILNEEGFDRKVIDAALAHNHETGKERESLLEKAIYCADPLTGLIAASTLVLPSKKIKELSLKSLKKRHKEKAFAKGADRNIIESCKEIGLELEEFMEIGLTAMQEISAELEL